MFVKWEVRLNLYVYCMSISILIRHETRLHSIVSFVKKNIAFYTICY